MKISVIRLLLLLGLLWITEACSVFGQTTPTTSRPERESPHFLVIVADGVGRNDLGCYGSTLSKTPHLDRLARSGVRFTEAFAAAPAAAATRASLLTGKHPARLKLTDDPENKQGDRQSPVRSAVLQTPLAISEITFAEVLRQAGYKTALGAAAPGVPECIPEKHGFTDILKIATESLPADGKSSPPSRPSTNALTEAACAFLAARDSHPFCLYLVYPPPEKNAAAPSEGNAPSGEKLRAQTEMNAAADAAHQEALVADLDASVGRILDKLEQRGLANHTVVLFLAASTSRRGSNPREPSPGRNIAWRGGAGELYEGGVRIPLLVRWPGISTAGTTSDAVVSTVDFLPTLRERLALDIAKAPQEGQSFLAELQRAPPGEKEAGGKSGNPGAAPAPRTLYWHYPHFSPHGGRPAAAIRQGEWKLRESYETGDVELFHLADDPEEQRNLSTTDPQRALELRKTLTRWRCALRTNKPRRNPVYNGSFWPPFGVEDFYLTDSAGKTVSKGDLLGRPWLACFVFTRCASTCPRVSARMKELQEATKGSPLQFVSFSVDPKNDTPQRLAQYSQGWGADPDRWHFLTSDPQRVEADKVAIFRMVHQSFRMPVEEAPHPGRMPGFEVFHSNNIVYVDAAGRLRGKYNAVDDTEMIKLRRVVQGKEAPVAPEAEKVVPLNAEDEGDADLWLVTPAGKLSVAGNAPAPVEGTPVVESGPPAGSTAPRPPDWVFKLPAINASLNALATVLLMLGGWLIKQRRITAHRRVMLTAFGVSIAFLLCYLVYHSFHWTQKFQGSALVRPIYYLILTTHVILAATVPFLAVTTILRGLRGDWERHRRIARLTYPIWLYVSVTGVIIYGMLYHWPVAG